MEAHDDLTTAPPTPAMAPREERRRAMRSASHLSPWKVASLVLGAVALTWHPALLLNDEILQAMGLHALGQGDFVVTGDLPEGYQVLHDKGFWHRSAPDDPEERSAPIGSTPLNLLALPLLVVLRPVAALIGVTPTLVLIAAALVGQATHTAMSMSRWAPRSRVVAGGVGLVVAVGALFLPAMAAEPFLEIASLQLVSMAALAATAALLWDLVRRGPAAFAATPTAFLFALATPAYFWGGSTKYHSLSLLFLVLTLWIYRDGAATSPRRTAAAFLVAGLAAWNQLPIGLLLLLSLGIVHLWRLRLGWTARLQRSFAAAGGAVVGLLPYVAQRLYEARLGLTTQFFGDTVESVAVAGAFATASFADNVRQSFTSGQFSHNIFTEPKITLKNLFAQIIFFPPVAKKPAMSILQAAPWAIAGLVALFRRTWRGHVAAPVRWMTLVYGGFLFGMGGRRLIRIGSGFDVRHVSTMWPAAALFSAPLLVGRLQRPRRIVLAGAAIFLLLAVAPLATVPRLAAEWGPVFAAMWTPRWLGFILALFALVAVLRGSGPSWRLTAAVAFGGAVQLYIKLGPQNIFVAPWASGPLLVWPLELLGRLVADPIFG